MVRIRAGESDLSRLWQSGLGLGPSRHVREGWGRLALGREARPQATQVPRTPQVPKSQLLWPPDLFQAPMRGWMNRGALVGPGVEPAT